MAKKTASIVLIMALVGLFFLIRPVAAGGELHALASSHEEMAEDALEHLRQAFVAEDRHAFFEGVAEDPFFSWEDLNTRVSDHFRDYSQIDLHVSIDHTLPDTDKVLVKTTWQRRWLNNKTGKLEENEGRAQFTFLIKDGVQLINIQGDSPF